MAGKQEFRGKLYQILEVAESQGRKMSVEEVKKFFEEDELSEEQIGLVCGYLLSQKIAVSGYVKVDSIAKEQTEEKEEKPKLTAEEQSYLTEYLREIGEMSRADEKDAQMAYYLPKVVEEAMRFHTEEVFLGDMIQEGNISLVMALADESLGEEQIMNEVRAGIHALLESQSETRRQDEKMVKRVAELDEVITNMTEEYGRKVAVDEVAEELGMTEDEIADILKLAGEEVEDEETEEE